MIKFTKMHGAGNDYIYINCFDGSEIIKKDGSADNEMIASISRRRFSVGSDGVILICRSDIADAKMRMFNADGSEGRMCGNAIRCVGKYLYDNGICKKNVLKIETLSGIKTLWLNVENGRVSSVSVDMGKADLTPSVIPVLVDAEKALNCHMNIGGTDYTVTCVSMGSPHSVVFVDDVDGFPLDTIGPLFENAPVFPDRVNAEFVKVIGKNRIQMRVWERGSGETLACGTGSCAVTVAACLNGYCDFNKETEVVLRGGTLYITVKDDLSVIMRGEAVKVYDGVIG